MRHALFALLIGVGSSLSASAAVYVTQYPDGTASGAGIWHKFTHTWQKTDGRWQIITGMCAAQEPLQTPRL